MGYRVRYAHPNFCFAETIYIPNKDYNRKENKKGNKKENKIKWIKKKREMSSSGI